MKFYMAPMEGLTGYVYRNAYHKHFGDVDKYFTPFITNKKLNHREYNDILPEHNAGMEVVPQILTNRAEDFLCIAADLKEYGYQTVNLNLGCPSGTVVAKNRGSGFLALPEELNLFLEEIFSKSPVSISIKTRIGKDSEAEWERLLSIYEKYPIEELIIHPRIQKDFYKNTPRWEMFGEAVKNSRHPLCYNGDICNVEDYRRMEETFPSVEKVMIGRGLLANPMLIQEIKNSMIMPENKSIFAHDTYYRKDSMPENHMSEGYRKGEQKETATDFGVARTLHGQPKKGECRETVYDWKRLRAFHDDILCGYQEVMSGDRNTLFKMKELWVYLGNQFEDVDKYLKKIKKAQRIREYVQVVDELFRAALR